MCKCIKLTNHWYLLTYNTQPNLIYFQVLIHQI